MKAFLSKYFPIIFIILFVFAYFFYLFFPELKLFVTPDFGQSDIVDLHIPMKYLLSQALKANTLPFWTQKLGNGFPLLAGLEIGALNPVNLILFKFFPFVIAFNLIYLVSFSINALGTYLFCQKIKFSKLTSLYVSLIYSFSGYLITQIAHTDVLQTIVFLPWYFYATYRLFNDEKKIFPAFLLSFIITISIFATYPQIVFISLLAATLFSIYLSIEDFKQKKVGAFVLFIVTMLLGVAMGAAQLVPAFEFLRASFRSQGLTLDTATYYSFPLKHLFTFLNPFALGNPLNGTYPPFPKFDGSVFWENTGYLGLIPLILAAFSLPLIKKNKKITFFLFLLFASLLLMLGKFSPLKFIYTFPGFSLFRVPSRFILLFVWSLIILSGFSLEFIKTKIEKHFSRYFSFAIIIIIFVLSFVDIQRYFYNYNSLLPADQILKIPQSAEKILPTSARVFDLQDEVYWNSIFLKGWGKFDTIPYFNNFLRRNVNVLYGVTQAQAYVGNLIQRNDSFDTLIYSGIQLTKNQQLIIGSASAKLLLMENVGYILSPYPVEGTGIKSAAIEISKDLSKIYISALPTSQRAYLVHEKIVADQNQQYSIVKDPGFNPWKMVLLEKNDGRDVSQQDQNSDQVLLTKSSEMELEFEVKTNSPGYLVVADTFYPGWQATVNEEKSEILLADIFQKAVFVPQGESKVRLYYYPQSFVTGLLISILALLAAVGFSILVYKKILTIKIQI